MDASTRSYAQRFAKLIREFDACKPTERDREPELKRKAEQRLTVWFTFANYMLEEVDRFRLFASMPRPATIPESEFGLWSMIEQVQRKGAKATKEAREVVADYNHWKHSVVMAECNAESWLRVWLQCIATLETIAEPQTITMAKRVRAMALEHYRCELPEAIPQQHDEREKLISISCRDYKALPAWMRSCSRPRGVFFPTTDTEESEEAI